MSKKNGLIIAIVIIIGVVASSLLHKNSDENLIKKQFNKLADSIKRDGKEGLLEINSSNTKFEKLFAEKIIIHVSGFPQSEFSNGELASLVSKIRLHYKKVTLKFSHIKIISLDKTIAQIQCDATLLTNDNKRQHSLECTMHKIDDKWLFANFSDVTLLEK